MNRIDDSVIFQSLYRIQSQENSPFRLSQSDTLSKLPSDIAASSYAESLLLRIRDFQLDNQRISAEKAAPIPFVSQSFASLQTSSMKPMAMMGASETFNMRTMTATAPTKEMVLESMLFRMEDFENATGVKELNAMIDFMTNVPFPNGSYPERTVYANQFNLLAKAYETAVGTLSGDFSFVARAAFDPKNHLTYSDAGIARSLITMRNLMKSLTQDAHVKSLQTFTPTALLDSIELLFKDVALYGFPSTNYNQYKDSFIFNGKSFLTAYEQKASDRSVPSITKGTSFAYWELPNDSFYENTRNALTVYLAARKTKDAIAPKVDYSHIEGMAELEILKNFAYQGLGSNTFLSYDDERLWGKTMRAYEEIVKDRPDLSYMNGQPIYDSDLGAVGNDENRLIHLNKVEEIMKLLISQNTPVTTIPDSTLPPDGNDSPIEGGNGNSSNPGIPHSPIGSVEQLQRHLSIKERYNNNQIAIHANEYQRLMEKAAAKEQAALIKRQLLEQTNLRLFDNNQRRMNLDFLLS